MRFFSWFNTKFDRLSERYTGAIGWILRRGVRILLVYILLLGVLGVGYSQLPTSFVPEEDQGNFMAMFELPAGATAERTLEIIAKYENTRHRVLILRRASLFKVSDFPALVRMLLRRLPVLRIGVIVRQR